MLELKLSPTKVITNDFYYDLFDGGCIEPESQLTKDSAQKVREAVFVIKAYQRVLENSDIIDYL